MPPKKSSKKKAASKPAKPAAAAPAPTPPAEPTLPLGDDPAPPASTAAPAPAPAASNDRKKKGKSVDWKETPYGVFMIHSQRAIAAFKTDKAALKYIQTELSPVKQPKAMIAWMQSVSVETKTKVTLNTPE
jgi:hypothetical protein